MTLPKHPQRTKLDLLFDKVPTAAQLTIVIEDYQDAQRLHSITVAVVQSRHGKLRRKNGRTDARAIAQQLKIDFGFGCTLELRTPGDVIPFRDRIVSVHAITESGAALTYTR